MSNAPQAWYVPPHETDRFDPGVPLRDYFAAAVLPAIIPNVTAIDAAGVASVAYAIADAMLAQRQRP